MSYDDPFETAAPIVSNFASVQSFRTRLILVKPVKTEMKPNKDTGQLQETITCDVTTVDGLGPVKVYSDGDDTGRTLEGPEHRGVWIGQQILVDQLKNKDGSLRKLILTRVDTKTPGEKAKKGNPWGFSLDITEADRQTARDFLAGKLVAQASGQDDKSPF